MSKRDRVPRCNFLVAGHGHRDVLTARSVGGAVAQFRQRHRLTLQTDKMTGGWKGVSFECKGEVA